MIPGQVTLSNMYRHFPRVILHSIYHWVELQIWHSFMNHGRTLVKFWKTPSESDHSLFEGRELVKIWSLTQRNTVQGSYNFCEDRRTRSRSKRSSNWKVNDFRTGSRRSVKVKNHFDFESIRSFCCKDADIKLKVYDRLLKVYDRLLKVYDHGLRVYNHKLFWIPWSECFLGWKCILGRKLWVKIRVFSHDPIVNSVTWRS